MTSKQAAVLRRLKAVSGKAATEMFRAAMTTVPGIDPANAADFLGSEHPLVIASRKADAAARSYWESLPRRA